VWRKVDSFFTDALISADPALGAALAANREGGLPAIDVTPLQGRFLEILLRSTGAKRVLEIGTLGGYSTIWMARAIESSGRVITLELDQHHAAIARRNLKEAGVADRVDLRVGPASESLAALVDQNTTPFDFIFIDADKAGYPDYIQWSLKLSRPGTLIIADNVVRDGKVIDPTNENIANKTYPLSRPLFLLTNGEPVGAAKSFVDFMLSERGQELVKKHGYMRLKDLGK